MEKYLTKFCQILKFFTNFCQIADSESKKMQKKCKKCTKYWQLFGHQMETKSTFFKERAKLTKFRQTFWHGICFLKYIF